jgi:hypothetical protein
MIQAPWTNEQVAALNRWQQSNWVHPFTCRCGKDLVATREGWRCGSCDYTQDWAHDSMLGDPEWLNPFKAARAAGGEG